MQATADSGSRPDARRPNLRLVRSDRGAPDRPGVAPADRPTSINDEIVSLYEREYAGVARLAYLLVADRHQAEDLAHDAFARLYERWNDLDDPDRAGAWLRTTVSNLAMSSHRRNGTARRHAAIHKVDDDRTIVSAEVEALGRAVRPDVLAALQALSAKQRTSIVLKHWLRYTETEIARTIGCSVGSVRTHLHRGHTALANTLGSVS